jgi:F-type H+-transporting ATPase subunit a
VSNDPIHQFHIAQWVPLHVGGVDLSFTNSSAFMVATVGVASAFLYLTSSNRGLIPTRLQSVSEMAYEFVASTLRESAGSAGMKFFPFVFSLFMFVLVANMLGMFPYFFTVTSQIIVTFALAVLVIGTVLAYGFAKHGFKFLGVFVPSGVPAPLLLLVVPIEIISFLCRFRCFTERAGRYRCRRRDPAARHDGRADRPRVPGGFPSGLRLHGTDLHVPE